MSAPEPSGRLGRAVVAAAAVLLALVAAVVAHRAQSSSSGAPVVSAPASVQAGGGFPIAGTRAPGFTLTDQFGGRVSLASLRGHEVVLAFVDSRCSTVCPLTAAIMRSARRRLGSQSGGVRLVAVNANPVATSVADVRRFSQANGMLHSWLYLTASAAELKRVYSAYQVYVCVKHDGQVVHTAAIYIIDPAGRERLYLQTLDSYDGVTVASETTAMAAGMRRWLSPGAS